MPGIGGGPFAKGDFTIDLSAGTVVCPAGQAAPLRAAGNGWLASLGAASATCPLVARCTTAKTGRTIWVGPYEEQVARVRARQADPDWKARYRANWPKVERNIGHLMRRRHGGRRARVRGTPKVGADLALLAAAVNLARLSVLGLTHQNGTWSAATGYEMDNSPASTPLQGPAGRLLEESEARCAPPANPTLIPRIAR